LNGYYNNSKVGIEEFYRQPIKVQEFCTSMVSIQRESCIEYPMLSILKIYRILLECQEIVKKLLSDPTLAINSK